MAGYWVIRSSDVIDQPAYEEYAKLWAPLSKKYQGKFIAGRGVRHHTVEGKDFPRVLVIEFPTYEDAMACYADPDYQKSLPLVRKACKYRDLVIVESN